MAKLQRYDVGDCEGGPRYSLEPNAEGEYVRFADVEAMAKSQDDQAKQLQTAIEALQWISNFRRSDLDLARTLHYDMNGKAQDALRKMGLIK